MDQWFDGLMDQLIGGPVEGRERDRECAYEIERGLRHYWWQVNTFRDIKLLH